MMPTKLTKSLIISLLFILPLHGQKNGKLNNKTSLPLTVLRLDSLGKAYESTNTDSSFFYYSLAIKAAQKSKDYEYVATTMNHLGFINNYLTKDQSKAIEWLDKAILIAKKNNDYLNLAESHKLLAVVVFSQNIGNPIELIDKAAAYAQQANSWRIELDCYEIKADFFVRRKEYSEAEKAFLKLLKISRANSIDDWFNNSLDYAKLLEIQNRQAEADAIYAELNTEKNKLKQSKGYFVYMNDTGTLATKLKKYDEAERIFFDVLAYEKAQVKVDTFRLSFIYDSLQELYKATGNYKKALESQEKWSEARLWLTNKRLTQDSQIKLTKLKANLDIEKKEIAIDLLETQKEEQLLLLVGAIFLASILAASVFYVQKSKKEIEQQREELSKLNATKDKLFTILSHDLRSPVANLENNVSLSNWGALSQVEFTESVQGLGTEVQRVRNMLENMFYWATSQMGGIKPNPSNVDAHQAIEEQLNFLKNKANAKAIYFNNQVPEDFDIYADKDHLSIIFRNLLQNAVKFTSDGGEIAISAHEQNNAKWIEIKDNGIGMPPDLVGKLFEIGENTSRAGTNLETGTGVGLILVKELAELNKLKLTVKSEVNVGSTFSILL